MRPEAPDALGSVAPVFAPGEGVTVGRLGRVLALRVHRPARQNALSRAAMAAFAAAVDFVAAEVEGASRAEAPTGVDAKGAAEPVPPVVGPVMGPVVGAVVLAGGDGRFLSGGDLKDLDEARGAADAAAFSVVMQGALGRLSALPVPVLAAIDRFALGGGLEAALAADLRVASAEATLAFRQAPLGVTTGWGAVPRLRALVGRSTALRLLLDGTELTAAEALALGLVDRVAPPGTSALAEALAWAEALAARPPAAISGLKRLVASLDLADGVGVSGGAAAAHEALERVLFGASWASADHWAAVAAHWAGRAARAEAPAPPLGSLLTSAPEAAPEAAPDAAQGAGAPSMSETAVPALPAKPGRFIVLEGLDGAGTTTQSRLLARWLRRQGRSVLETAEPSKGPLGTLIRQALNRRLVGAAGEPFDPRGVAALFVADRADHLSGEVEPALAAGRDVVCDRYVHSSLAYQGATCDAEWVAAMNAPMRAADLVVFVRVSPEVASARRQARGGVADLYEVDAFQRTVAAGYERALSLRPADPVAVVDGDGGVRAVHRAICAAIERHFGATPAADCR